MNVYGNSAGAYHAVVGETSGKFSFMFSFLLIIARNIPYSIVFPTGEFVSRVTLREVNRIRGVGVWFSVVFRGGKSPDFTSPLCKYPGVKCDRG